MKQENRNLLDSCRIYREQLRNGGKVHGISYHQRQEIERVVRDEFIPGYTSRMDCENCVNEMIINAYVFYDKYLKDEGSK